MMANVTTSFACLQKTIEIFPKTPPSLAQIKHFKHFIVCKIPPAVHLIYISLAVIIQTHVLVMEFHKYTNRTDEMGVQE